MFNSYVKLPEGTHDVWIPNMEWMTIHHMDHIPCFDHGNVHMMKHMKRSLTHTHTW